MRKFMLLFISILWCFFMSNADAEAKTLAGITVDVQEVSDISSISACRKEEISSGGDSIFLLDVEPEKHEVSKDNSIFSPDVVELINGTELTHAAALPDTNENVEGLRAFLDGMNKVKQSIKKRTFGDEIDTKSLPIGKWLEEGEKYLLSMREKYPESRHVSEGLGRIYKELYEHTQNRKYLEKAADAFIHAEKLGMKYGVVGVPHYVQEVSDVLATLYNRNRLDSYFFMVIEVFPENEYVYLHYAKALSKLNDKRAEEFFEKAISLREDGNFQPIVEYAEHLLDRGDEKEAIGVLQQLSPSEDYAYFPHFLKGFALEKMGRLKEAEEEYKKYLRFRDSAKTSDEAQFSKYFFRVLSKYRIPGSELQKGIPFKDERTPIIIGKGLQGNSTPEATVSASAVYRDTTPYCSPDDWICKATYYVVWTINGEAERGGGTTGMMRAVAWNMRTRVFWNYTEISCYGVPFVCTNYAKGYTYTPNDVVSLARRYYYVIETGSYQGLLVGNYTAKSEQAVYDVIVNGNVPDPNAGRCFPYGNPTVTGDACSGTCGYSAGLWDSFRQSESSNEFRGGYFTWENVDFSCKIQELVPYSPPTGGSCGASCYILKGVICPRMGYTKCQGTCSSDCNYDPRYGWLTKSQRPVYGNFFWHF